MKCPVCRTITLESDFNDNKLINHSCPQCKGSWIKYEDYEEWKRKNSIDPKANGHAINSNSTNDGESNEYMPEYDSKRACLCPDCGRILIKYLVTKDIPFYVDHCSSCNGVWLDKNEWDVLAKNHIHTKMNHFFTRPWQNRLREEMTKVRLEVHYANKFGTENYNKLKEIREWLKSSDLSSEMIAYLIDEDPYKL